MFGLAKAFGRLNVAAGVTKSVYTASAVSRLHTTAQRYQQSSKPPTADQTASSAFDIAEEASGSGPAAASEYRIVSAGKGQGTVKIREYEYSTANFHVSPQKLRMIGNQITGLSVTEAIRQMQFSAKKASDRIKHSL
ncbi:39S ribosomal protein L22, mitochondrial, partial [Linderina pennispora]